MNSERVAGFMSEWVAGIIGMSRKAQEAVTGVVADVRRW
jgi:hypothetical protein